MNAKDYKKVEKVATTVIESGELRPRKMAVLDSVTRYVDLMVNSTLVVVNVTDKEEEPITLFNASFVYLSNFDEKTDSVIVQMSN